jgi:hypothetical protein
MPIRYTLGIIGKNFKIKKIYENPLTFMPNSMLIFYENLDFYAKLLQ